MKGYKWRIYADNNIESEIVAFLRQSKMDVVYVAEDPKLKKEKDDRFHFNRARKLKCILLTHDEDFWNDKKYPLHLSPGLILLASKGLEVNKYLPILFRKLFQETINDVRDPLFLEKIKTKLSDDGIVIKLLDHETQKKTTTCLSWVELGLKRK